MTHLKDSKLVDLLRILSIDEFKQLNIWLQSPWANTNKKLIQLYKIIEKHFPDFNHKALEKKIIFKKLYRGKNYDNKVLNNLMSELNKQVETFLSHERVRTNSSIQDNLLREVMLERQQPKPFETLTHQLICSLNKSKVKTADQHWQLSQLYRQLYYQPSEHNRYFSDQPILEKADYHLNAFYALTKYQLLHEVRDSRAILKKKSVLQSDISLFDSLRMTLQLPTLNLYNLRLQRSDELSWEDYQIFKQYYYKHFEELSNMHQRDFFFFCINDTVVLNIKGVTAALPESLILYKYGLEQGLLMEHQSMSGITFNNIIIAASELEDVLFLRKFIHKYVSYLNPEIQKEARCWAMAQLALIAGQYDDGLALLKDEKIEHPLFKIQSRVTLIKVLYHLRERDATNSDMMEAYYKSTTQFLRRDNLFSKKRKSGFIRFVQFAIRLADYKNKKNSTKQLHKLFDTISNDKNLISKRWLLKMASGILNELEKK